MAKQIFFDDFRYSSLDASKWSPVWGKFDPNKGTQMRFSDKNIYVGDGLNLYASVATGTDAEKAPFLSGMVNTRKPDKGEILFQAKGQFILSVQANLPTAGPSWPGIWMTGTKGDWPACGEIDVVEAKGWIKNNFQMNVHNPRANEPTKSQQHAKSLSQTQSTLKESYVGTRLHTYSVVKLDDRVDFYLNTELVHTVMYSEMDDPTPFTDPENGWIIRLSHIIGGSFLEYDGNREYVDATKHKKAYPSNMYINYVRVISLDDPGTVPVFSDKVDIVKNYLGINPEPPVVTPQPQPPVVVPPTPARPEMPAPPQPQVPAAEQGEVQKHDGLHWDREKECIVFVML